MYIPSKNNSITSNPSLIQTLEGVSQKTAYEINCMRIGIVQTFYPEDLTVDVLIANKKTKGYTKEGVQIVGDYPIIRAKVVYCDPFITFPINPGDECVLLFSDREIENWFINGEVNPEGYTRMHEMTDAVALFAIRSLPKMIEILLDALHLFYGDRTEIQLKDDKIISNTASFEIEADDATVEIPDVTFKGDVTQIGSNTQYGDNAQVGNNSIWGNTTQTGTITATNLNATAAATNIFYTVDNKKVTVVNGIVIEITDR